MLTPSLCGYKIWHIHPNPAASLSNPTHWEDARNTIICRLYFTIQFCLVYSQCQHGATRYCAVRTPSSTARNPSKCPTKPPMGLHFRDGWEYCFLPPPSYYSYYYYVVIANHNKPMPYTTSSLCNHCLKQHSSENLSCDFFLLFLFNRDISMKTWRSGLGV